jgi:hypothetical protein
VGLLRPERLPEDPDAVQARKDAKLVLMVANCALRGQGGRLDPAMIEAIALDERMSPRTQRRAATILARLRFADVCTLPWWPGRA